MPKVTTDIEIEWDVVGISENDDRMLNLASCVVHAPTADLGRDVVTRLLKHAVGSFDSDQDFYTWLTETAEELASQYANDAREVLIASGISNEELTAALTELRGNDG